MFCKMRITIVWFFVFAFVSPYLVIAQNYPIKSIRIVVPFSAGGFSDLYARIIASKLQESGGQPVIVENRPGAGGNIGTEIVARSAGDGYNLLMGGIGTHAINPAVYRKLPYDPFRDFTPIAFVVDSEGVLVIHPSIPVYKIRDLIAISKMTNHQKNDVILTFGTAGSGSTSHLAAEVFKSMAQVNWIHVPYKSNASAVSELVGGQISMVFAPVSISLPFIKSQRLRAIAVMGKDRSDTIPSVPTVDESGLPGFEVKNWAGLFAPSGTALTIVTRLNAEVVKTLQTPEIKARLVGEGLRANLGSADQFANFVKSEFMKWGQVVRAIGIGEE